MTLSLLQHLYPPHQLGWESHSRQHSERLETLQGTRDLPSTLRRRDREAVAPRGATLAARPVSRRSVQQNNVLRRSGQNNLGWLFAVVNYHMVQIGSTK